MNVLLGFGARVRGLLCTRTRRIVRDPAYVQVPRGMRAPLHFLNTPTKRPR